MLQHHACLLVAMLPAKMVIGSNPLKLYASINSSLSCLGHGSYHRNRKLTKTAYPFENFHIGLEIHKHKQISKGKTCIFGWKGRFFYMQMPLGN